MKRYKRMRRSKFVWDDYSEQEATQWTAGRHYLINGGRSTPKRSPPRNRTIWNFTRHFNHQRNQSTGRGLLSLISKLRLLGILRLGQFNTDWIKIRYRFFHLMTDFNIGRASVHWRWSLSMRALLQRSWDKIVQSTNSTGIFDTFYHCFKNYQYRNKSRPKSHLITYS